MIPGQRYPRAVLRRLRRVADASKETASLKTAVKGLEKRLDEQSAHLEHMRALLEAMNLRDAVLADRLGSPKGRASGSVLEELQHVLDALQVIYDDEPGNRRRLAEARASSEYALAYTQTDPLVSVLIPTYTSYETLRDRAIPSILEQSYTEWEIVVVGDGAPPETAEVISSFGNSRIRYENKLMRGPYPEDDYDAWLVSAVPPFNLAMRLARGQWLAPFADDDSLRPHALEALVSKAQSDRLEFCYSKMLLHARSGESEVIGAYPPRLSLTGISAGMQGSMLHAQLRFFEQELADVIFRTPSDWSWVRKMLRAGVRIGFLDDVTADYYPSYRGEDAGGIPLR